MYRVEIRNGFDVEPVVNEYISNTEAMSEVIRFTSQSKLGEDPDEEFVVKELSDGGTEVALWTKIDGQDFRIYQILLTWHPCE